MTIAARLTRQPRPIDPEAAADARARFSDLSPEVQDLLASTAGCSPYLAGLMAREADWLTAALEDPEAARDDVISGLALLEHDKVEAGLRIAKRRMALLVAIADLGGVWPLETVTAALTDLADAACRRALQAGLWNEIRRKKLPGMEESDLENGAGMVVLAMGKMGAHELNYSSDIDLICLFDETRFAADDFHEARSAYVRATRRMTALMNDLTGEGYVFRTDLRLRPDPSVTPVCIAMEAAERYYESLGRTWERAAYIKARAAAGDPDAGSRFLRTLTPFVWRKHLDFAAIQDAHDMRLRIREHKGRGGLLDLMGHDLKLGRGGIREIEFFTQTRQLIAGGRDPLLRVRGTVEGLDRLSERGWVAQDTADRLKTLYREHREMEHRLQMIRDAQTQTLPKTDEGFDRLAAFMGTDTETLKSTLQNRLEEVHALTEGFFAPGAQPSAAEAPPSAEPAGDPDGEDPTARWLNYPALRSERAVGIFQRLKPGIMARLNEAARPDEALIAFDGFLSGLPAGVQLFSLFEANPQLIDLLVDIVGTSPALAAHLSRNSGVFDAVIGGDFFSPWPGADELAADLKSVLDGESDYERKLDATRRWAKEWHFRVGVHHLRGLIGASEVGQQYADLAGATLKGLWPEVIAKFSERHGPPPGNGGAVLGMGSLGAERLNAASDLDVIVIYDADGVDSSDGPRPLATRLYYARLTQALVTAVSAPTAEGRLYEVDMRLRPSGNQGPVATSFQSFRDYQENSAWVWEHLALTRARPIAGPAVVCEEIETFRREVLPTKGDPARVLPEVAAMRARIAAAKSGDGPLDAKIGPGRLLEIELIAQAGLLTAGLPDRDAATGFAAAVKAGWLSEAQRKVLQAAYTLCWQVQCATKLLTTKAIDTDGLGQSGGAFLCRETGQPDIQTLESELARVTSAAAEVISAVLPEPEDVNA